MFCIGNIFVQISIPHKGYIYLCGYGELNQINTKKNNAAKTHDRDKNAATEIELTDTIIKNTHVKY